MCRDLMWSDVRCDLCLRLVLCATSRPLAFGPLVFHFRDEVVGPSFVQPPVGGSSTPCVSLVQRWVKSGLDSRRLSYLSALVAEGLGSRLWFALPQLVLASLPYL